MPQTSDDLYEVPYPPPPARVEFIPARPSAPEAVWVDGEWAWQGRRWSWKRGRWVVPPKDARFSPWTVVRDDMGVLYVAEGTFRDARGARVAEPEPLATARTTPQKATPAAPRKETPSQAPAPQPTKNDESTPSNEAESP